MFTIVTINSQVLLESYSESNTEIKLNLKLGSVDLLERNSENGFYDESETGHFALPTKSIIVGIPFSDNYKYSYKIISKSEDKFNLGFNPEVNPNSEGNLKYNFSPSKLFKDEIKPIVKVKGYFWQDEMYCVHLEINQYSYDEINSILASIKEVEIKIGYAKPSNLSKSTKSGVNKNILTTLINGDYITKYWGKPKNIIVRDTTDNWIDYHANYLKIGVAEDGIYRIEYDDLTAMGISTNMIVPKTLKLFMKGNEQPIFVSGAADNVFDATDYIEFVGIRNMGGHHREISGYDQPYNEYLGRYTDTTIYWLTWDGVDGERVQISDGILSNITDTLHYYSEVVHSEKNGWYDFAYASLVRREMPYWTENKTWNEGNIVVGVKSNNFTVSEVFPKKKIKILCKMQDYVSNISSKAHLVSMSLNSYSEFYDSTYIDKYQKVVLKAELNSTLLSNGNNVLKIHSFPTDASINVCVLDWFEVEYPRYLKPVNNTLVFSFPDISVTNSKLFKLLDISTDSFSLWKYGESIKKYDVLQNNNQITISDTIKLTDKFFYCGISQIKSPKIYYLKKFANLRNTENKADYIAITHKKFRNKVEEYSKFIGDNYNVVTKVIDIDDIYDEYSYGFFNPEAIKDFLISTHDNWQESKPTSVVLIGGATYDYYGNKYKYVSSVTERVINYVPSFGASVSDNWFVVWDTTGAYIPQMNIGRLSVTTNEEFDWYFEKHKNYLEQEYNDWNKRYMFFSSGDASNPSEVNSMYESNQFVIDNYVYPKPIGGNAEHFFKTIEPPTNFGHYSSEYFQNAINNGAVFISYLGHSGTQIWDNSITNPAQLKNDRNRYPIVSDFGCSTGRFAEPDVTSFSELFTIGNDGQALGYIGNASLGFVSTSLVMPKLFYKKILKENIFQVSEAHKQAKLEMLQTYGSTGIYELFALTNTFIGDPLLSLPIPTKPNFYAKNENIILKSGNLTDLMDSVDVIIKISNFGMVPDDTLQVLVEHEFLASNDSTKINVNIPNFSDSLVVSLPIKNNAGYHTIKISLDPNNKYEEISEADNIAQKVFNVASSSIRPLLNHQFINGLKNNVKFLNPSSCPNEEKIVLDLSYDSQFRNFSTYELSFDSVVSPFSLSNLSQSMRFWGRTKLKGESNYTETFSFLINGSRYLLHDSLSFAFTSISNLYSNNNNYLIDSTNVKFELFSAGFDDGQAAIISRNGVNYVPTPKVGHQVVLFNSQPPYEFVEFHYFNTLAGGSEITKYNALLDTVSSNYFVAIAISDEGTPRDANLKANIKSLGSQYIDKVGWRASWAFIGKKGATPGTMPEAYSKSGDGPVTIDTTISFLSEKGSMLTSEIGPTGKWDRLVVDQETPSNSVITYTPIGIKEDGVLDTLSKLVLSAPGDDVGIMADLSFIDPTIYPKIKILADFAASDDKQSPVLKSLGVDYNDVAELAMNYQVVSVEKDSIVQGDKNKLNFYIYNVGETEADSVSVKIELKKPDNSKMILNEFVTSIDSSSRNKFSYDFEILNSYGFGNMAYSITVDEQNKITEFFKDNNYYEIPFYVKKDTTVNVNTTEINVKFDGFEIMDGDFVSNQPTILFELNYSNNFPVGDTTAVVFTLDNKRVYTSKMNVDYDTINKTISYLYEPELEDGQHYLKVTGKPDIITDNSFGIDKLFTVSNKLKAVDIYNFPNPASDETDFTFRLAKVPESLDIKIYTIAGRLIKIFELQSYELKTDINKVHWNLKDEDGDKIANGVYLYKVILRDQDKVEHYTQKLAIVR